LIKLIKNKVDHERGHTAVYDAADAILLTMVALIAGARSLSGVVTVWADAGPLKIADGSGYLGGKLLWGRHLSKNLSSAKDLGPLEPFGEKFLVVNQPRVFPRKTSFFGKRQPAFGASLGKTNYLGGFKTNWAFQRGWLPFGKLPNFG